MRAKNKLSDISWNSSDEELLRKKIIEDKESRQKHPERFVLKEAWQRELFIKTIKQDKVDRQYSPNSLAWEKFAREREHYRLLKERSYKRSKK